MGPAAPAERVSRGALSVRFAIKAASQGRGSCHHRPDAGQPGPGTVVARRASYRPFQASARYLGGHSRTRREAGEAR
jgi:hypothetical protein